MNLVGFWVFPGCCFQPVYQFIWYILVTEWTENAVPNHHPSVCAVLFFSLPLTCTLLHTQTHTQNERTNISDKHFPLKWTLCSKSALIWFYSAKISCHSVTAFSAIQNNHMLTRFYVARGYDRCGCGKQHIGIYPEVSEDLWDGIKCQQIKEEKVRDVNLLWERLLWQMFCLETSTNKIMSALIH